MEKSEVIQKIYIFTPVACRYKILYFHCETIKYALYFISIFLYFTTLYIIKGFQLKLVLDMYFSFCAGKPDQYEAPFYYKISISDIINSML